MDFLDWLDPGPEAGLGAVFLICLLAATLLPGGSEPAFALYVIRHPESSGLALALATLGNTLGGLITYAMGRALPQGEMPKRARWVQRHGAPALGLAWLPIVGDALCLAAGWLRLPLVPCTLWMAAGKGARYALVMAGVSE